MPTFIKQTSKKLLRKTDSTPVRLILFTPFFLLIFASHIHAAGAGFGVGCGTNQTYIGIFDACLDFGQVIGGTVSWAMIIGTMLALIKFAIGAINFVMSAGDPGKLENARITITDAMIGLVLMVSAWVMLGYLNASFPDDWQINFFTLFG